MVTTAGHEYSKMSIRTMAGPAKIKGLKQVTYGDNLEPGVVRSDRPYPIGLTRGEYSAEASMVWATRRHFQEFLEELTKDTDGEGAYEIFFTMSHIYSEKNITPLLKDVVPLCRIKKPNIDAQGTDAVEVSVDLSVLGVIEWNGVKPIFTDDD